MLFHVISSHKNKGLHNDGNTHIIEYFYPKRALENAEGKPLAEMIRSVSDALAGEEIKDTTGLAEREEVNGSSVREHRVYHGSGADFDAFDHSHMGEGEGAQAYGWGTYVTKVDGIGKTYAIYHPHTIYHNTNYRKNEKPGKYTFFRTNETYSTCQHVAIVTLLNTCGFINGSVKANTNLRDSAFKTQPCVKDKNRDVLSYFFR